MTETETLVEEEQFTKDKELSIQKIVLEHIRKISNLCVQEMRSGYWEEKPLKSGIGMMMSKVYHPDGRLAYIEAVNFLLDMVRPIMDDDFKKGLTKLEKEEDKKFQEIKKESKNKEDWVSEKKNLRRKLFAEIILLLYRTNFFQEESFGDTGS